MKTKPWIFIATSFLFITACHGFEAARFGQGWTDAPWSTPPPASWSDVKALGPRVPAPQAGDLAAAPAQISIGWNAPSSQTANVSGYKIFRATSSGGEDFSSPVATITSPATRKYTDTSVSSGVTYYYVVQPILSAADGIKVEPAVDQEIAVTVPPPNMALVHPWIANLQICSEMGREVDPRANYRCLYHGPGHVGAGYFDMQKPLYVDTFGEGCNYTHGTDCNGGDCIGIGGKPSSSLGSDGDVYYDRNGSKCYLKTAGNWAEANELDAAALAKMISNAPGLPPMAQISQTQSSKACQAVSVPGFANAKRLLSHREQIVAAAWSPELSEDQVADLENGKNLYTTLACNTNQGSGLTFETAAKPSDPNTIASMGAATQAFAVRNGSTATTNCVSRFGIQDLVGNLFNWNSDQLGTCDRNSRSCTGIASTLDPSNQDWAGMQFDGRNGPACSMFDLETSGIGPLKCWNATGFQVALGLPMPASASQIWDYKTTGVGADQFNPARFHGNIVEINPENSSSDSPQRGALAGGNAMMAAGSGRYTLYTVFPPSFHDSFAGFRCGMN